MSVTITDLGFKFMPVLATNPTIPDNKYKPNKIMHEWLWCCQGIGDGTSGVISASLDFGTFDKNHYIAITCFFAKWGSTASSLYIETHTDRWDNLYFPGHADEAIFLARCQSQSDGPLMADQLKKPLYLGRPRLQDSDPGLCTVKSGNNSGEIFNVTIQGYTLERPLPFSSILQP